ncbi:MAG: DsbC family protein [Gammaproteobacteria bacterium]|nr:DsbC family protein [Gammaproteobacteria bacterium]
MKSNKTIYVLSIFLFATHTVVAQEQPPAVAIEAIQKFLPGIDTNSIKKSPVSGLYEAVYGMNVLYVSSDGRFLVQGDVFDVDQTQNLTEQRRKAIRVGAIEDLGESSMIIFSPEEVTSKITIFTDVDCGYCRKLHGEMSELHSNGVEVRYLAFPRAGVGSESYDKMVSVWCADDPKQAMTLAKQNQTPPPKTCENPVKNHYLAGELLPVRGTPTIILADGTVVSGYLPAPQLSAQAHQASSNAQLLSGK